MNQKIVLFSLAVCMTVFARDPIMSYTDPRDNKEYNTIELHFQPWMMQNMNYKLPGSFCYDDDERNCELYGRLYTWEAAQKACPEGWHLPSEEEWSQLVENGKTVENEHEYWRGYDFLNFNESAGGFRNSKGKYELKGIRADFWSSTPKGNDKARYWFWSNKGKKLADSDYSKKGALSVRCISDCAGMQSGYCDGTIERWEAWEEFSNDKIFSCVGGTYMGQYGYAGTERVILLRNDEDISCFSNMYDEDRIVKKEELVNPAFIPKTLEKFAAKFANEKTDFYISKDGSGNIKFCVNDAEEDIEGINSVCVTLDQAKVFLTPRARTLLEIK